MLIEQGDLQISEDEQIWMKKEISKMYTIIMNKYIYHDGYPAVKIQVKNLQIYYNMNW